MAKPVGKFVNVNEDWELNDWLSRNGYRETKDNRTELVRLVGVIKSHYDKESSDNLSWAELDAYHESYPYMFTNLEEKAE